MTEPKNGISNPNGPSNAAQPTAGGGFFRQGWGKLRRYILGHFMMRRVRRHHARRTGDCSRCGACCKLMFRCPHLIEQPDGLTSCRVHGRRAKNCRIFPINEMDLADRDRICSSIPCGYAFKSEG